MPPSKRQGLENGVWNDIPFAIYHFRISVPEDMIFLIAMDKASRGEGILGE